ncbi:MAG: hypothetical protein J0H47_14835 [Gammaproteobacteria bacterium]|nr:hypothetical protein [Gammaproteobacteria bacterium]
MKKLAIALLCSISLISFCSNVLAATQSVNSKSGYIQLADWWWWDRHERRETWCDHHPKECHQEWCRHHPKACAETWCEKHPVKCRKKWCHHHPEECRA